MGKLHTNSLFVMYAWTVKTSLGLEDDDIQASELFMTKPYPGFLLFGGYQAKHLKAPQTEQLYLCVSVWERG